MEGLLAYASDDGTDSSLYSSTVSEELSAGVLADCSQSQAVIDSFEASDQPPLAATDQASR